MSDLEAATTTQLLDELNARCEYLVLAYQLNGEDRINFSTAGTANSKVGAAVQLRRFVRRTAEADEYHPHEDDGPGEAEDADD